jgi:Bacterial membrane protein YfhO
MNRSLREYTCTFALLVATLAVAFYPVLFNGRTMLPSDLIDTMTLPFSQYFGPQQAYNSLITDASQQLYPLKYYTKQAYEHCNFAFWNPYVLNGYPQYLEGMWTYNFALFLPFAFSFPLLLLLPLPVAGVGMYALLREYEVRPGIARIFATAYMLNALFITHLLNHFIPASFSFAPFVLLLLHKYERSPKFKFIGCSSVALALGFLGGNIQTVGFLIFLAACYWTSLWYFRSRRSIGKLVRPLSITLGFAVGLSAIMLLPVLALLHETANGGAFFSTSLLRSYDVLQRVESLFLSFTFFIPQLAGSIRGVTFHQAIGVYAQDFEGAIGFLPLLIAVSASFALWKQKPEIRPFVILMITGIFLPIATPLFRFIYHRFFIIFILGVCGAGALGLEAILSSAEWNVSLRKWIKVFAYGLGAVVGVLAAFSLVREFDFPLIEHFARTHLLPRLQAAVFAEGNAEWVRQRFAETLDYWRLTRVELLVGIASAFIALAILGWRKRFSPRSFQVVVWIITAAQLILFVRLWVPMLDTSKYPLYPETVETRLLEASSKNARVYFYREIDTTKQFAFMNNENVVYGIPEATGYASMTPRCLYIYTTILHLHNSGLVNPKFLGKFNVGTLARVKPLPFDSLVLENSGPLWIYKNPWASPRAYLAYNAEILPDDTAILRRMSDDTASWPAAYFTPEEKTKNLHASSAIGDTVAITHASENEIEMMANSHDSSYLVLTDTYYPGWEATIDGVPTPILRCNYAMRAIVVPPGKHSVTFTFRPTSFRIGAWISLLSLVALIGLCIAKRQKR